MQIMDVVDEGYFFSQADFQKPRKHDIRQGRLRMKHHNITRF